jgi:hypothetical protein
MSTVQQCSPDKDLEPDFSKRPDPDPDLNKLFVGKIFLIICGHGKIILWHGFLPDLRLHVMSRRTVHSMPTSIFITRTSDFRTSCPLCFFFI